MKLRCFNSRGETLVEVIVGILVLAIASVCLVFGFVSSANIVNRATLLKNASCASSSSIEVENSYDVNFQDLAVDVSSKNGQIDIRGERENGEIINVRVAGNVVAATETSKTDLTFREFTPGQFSAFDEHNP